MVELASGHAAIQMIPEKDVRYGKPRVSPEALRICQNGEEVTVLKPELRAKLSESEQKFDQTTRNPSDSEYTEISSSSGPKVHMRYHSDDDYWVCFT